MNASWNRPVDSLRSATLSLGRVILTVRRDAACSEHWPEATTMGHWDAGIFNGDEAQDLLGDVLEPLVNTVRIGVSALGVGSSPDFQYAKNVIPAVACLRHLATGINKCVYSMQRSEVESWRDAYLTWHDREGAEEWDDSGNAISYRQAASHEFDLLLSVLEEWPADDWEEMREASIESFNRKHGRPT